jgi:hypothetical protein
MPSTSKPEKPQQATRIQRTILPPMAPPPLIRQNAYVASEKVKSVGKQQNQTNYGCNTPKRF